MNSQSTVIAVIPARGGSKGIKNKNLQKVGGLTLVEWSIRAAVNSELVSSVILTSDSEEILSSATMFVKKLPLGDITKVHFHKRPDILASDNSEIIETLREIVRSFSLSRSNCDAILMLQPTSPFRRAREVDHFLEFSLDNGNYMPSVSVKEVTDSHPARMYFIDENRRLAHSLFFKNEEFSPRQSLTKLYLRDGAYYLMTLEMIENGTPVVDKSKAFLRTYPFNLNIDENSDLELSRIEFQKVKNEL
jgi:CMP-N-acetylneuraminic acid synthetase